MFSVSVAAGGNPTNRAIVTFEGCNKGIGSWVCTKDTKNALHNEGPCLHITKSLEEFQTALGLDLEGEGEGEANSPIVGAWGFRPICHNFSMLKLNPREHPYSPRKQRARSLSPAYPSTLVGSHP